MKCPHCGKGINELDDKSFDVFWKAYPRKVSKEGARKAWKKLKVTDEVLTEMLFALDWQSEQWEEKRYIPHPATWLNNRRWEDEQEKDALKEWADDD